MDREGSDSELITISIPDEYVEHGNVDILKKEIGIDEETVYNKIMSKATRIW
jgi:1-deoxy-D-xylulose-5-phosphate synthase